MLLTVASPFWMAAALMFEQRHIETCRYVLTAWRNRRKRPPGRADAGSPTVSTCGYPAALTMSS
ncbi:hypothetical protein, partial [Cupriavidus pinatubonensis]|uniref:hypothetical protein n=1 Tax=Cupriavidus pinatubonensis TaxID=248026 RepID=UPI001C63610F